MGQKGDNGLKMGPWDRGWRGNTGSLQPWVHSKNTISSKLIKLGWSVWVAHLFNDSITSRFFSNCACLALFAGVVGCGSCRVGERGPLPLLLDSGLVGRGAQASSHSLFRSG